ncbi:MAG: hypothetical protein GY795_16865 [Desulfobacterales bacterium]|nr:hypothetical protein [Desulfobacterales bacterium]
MLITVLCVLILIILINNSVIFFIFAFELVTVLLLILITLGGYEVSKYKASIILFVYSTISSSTLLFFISLKPYFNVTNVSSTVDDLMNLYTFLNLLIIFSFSIKIPIFPFTIWLPLAHAEASTEGSIILTAGLLKLSVFGILRFWLQCFLVSSKSILVILKCLSCISILAATFSIIKGYHVKKIVALSSIIHMGFISIAILHMTSSNNIVACTVLLLAHSVSSSVMFFFCGYLIAPLLGSYSIYLFPRLGPSINKLLFIIILFNCGWPFTLSFFGEVSILLTILNSSIIFSLYVVILTTLSLCIILLKFIFPRFEAKTKIIQTVQCLKIYLTVFYSITITQIIMGLLFSFF